MPTYCTATDVANFLQRPAFSSSTTPTDTVVNDFIDANESYINQKTQTAFTITSSDTYNLTVTFVRDSLGFYTGMVSLRHSKVQDLDSGQGDVFKVWNGSQYEDYLTTKTSGRDNDYWLDNDRGILFLRLPFLFSRILPIQIKYRYGYSTVPNAIKMATIMLTAADVLENSEFTSNTISGSDVDYRNRIERLRKRANQLIRPFITYKTVIK